MSGPTAIVIDGEIWTLTGATEVRYIELGATELGYETLVYDAYEYRHADGRTCWRDEYGESIEFA